MNLSEASKKEIDVVLGKCGWRQTKQRVILLKSIFDGRSVKKYTSGEKSS